MKNVVFIPNIDLGNGRNKPYEYSIKSWKHFCDKYDCELLVLEDLLVPVESMKVTWQRFYLFDILEQNDFIEIFGENYTMTQKIQIFNNAMYVVGAIGGTVSNCIFCNSSCKVICLVSPDFLNINYRMKFLFNENVKLFKETYLDCNEGEIPINVRVEITDKKSQYYDKLGEINKKIGNKYFVKLSNNMIGWNENEKYDTIFFISFLSILDPFWAPS